MAYDEARGKVVVCANDAVAPTLEVFEYDGTQWSHPVPAIRPQPLTGARAAYDPHRGRTVLYGGRTGPIPSVPNTDFFEWDGAQWSRTTPVVRLGNRTGIGFAYDERARRFVLTNGGPIAKTLPQFADPSQQCVDADIGQIAHDQRAMLGDDADGTPPLAVQEPGDRGIGVEGRRKTDADRVCRDLVVLARLDLYAIGGAVPQRRR